MISEGETISARARASEMAKACAALGARIDTIAAVTRLGADEISKLCFGKGKAAPRGRPLASSLDWYYEANMIEKAEASIFMGIFLRIRDLGIDPDRALVTGFKEYLHGIDCARLSFDRAFVLVCSTEGIWSSNCRAFAMKQCARCHNQYVRALGDDTLRCPFCHLAKRERYDQRVQAWFARRRELVPACPADVPDGRQTVSRELTRSISGYFPACMQEMLSFLAQCSGKTRQTLFGEALMGLFGKYWELLQEGYPDSPAHGSGQQTLQSLPKRYRRCDETASRRGKRIIAGHYPPSTSQALHALAKSTRRTNQSLLEEALADLFLRYDHLLNVDRPSSPGPRAPPERA